MALQTVFPLVLDAAIPSETISSGGLKVVLPVLVAALAVGVLLKILRNKKDK